MRYLYVFPHPDDESFGPAPGIAKQLEQGHEVHLLTLTRGGATKQRHRLGLSIEEMGGVRLAEMHAVEQVLGLSSMTVLDLPDSGLKELDPREIERAVAECVERLSPDILVTYPVHGISGFHDHLVTHAVVKRVFEACRQASDSTLQRLAFFTVGKQLATDSNSSLHTLHHSTQEEIDCVIEPEERHVTLGQRALDCYTTYQEVIDKTGIREKIIETLHYEIYRESFQPPLIDLTLQLT